MELLFNLAWLTVAISLWGFWFGCRARADKRSRVSSAAVQWMALATLTAILLPVISITDDLHACQFPAEVKRSVLQIDQHHNSTAAPGILPFALALLALCVNSLFSRSVAFIALRQSVQLRLREHFRTLWCRPPPAIEA